MEPRPFAPAAARRRSPSESSAISESSGVDWGGWDRMGQFGCFWSVCGKGRDGRVSAFLPSITLIYLHKTKFVC